MKRRISAAAAVTAALLLTAHSAAYGLFCSDVTAPAMQESSADLAEISAKFETALNAPETEPGTSEAETAESRSETVAELYAARMELYNSFCSEHSAMEYSLAEKLRDDKYYELQSLLFDISALKTEIEAQTGETLSSDFDFSSAYLITDALKLSAAELSDWGCPGTICVPEGAEYSPEQSDFTAQYNAAVQGYYTLGEALRGYVSAAEDYESAAAGAKVGTVSASELEQLRQTYGEARLEALQKKADYAVALLKLDQASGGALTSASGAGEGLTEALHSALPGTLRGEGLWFVRRSGTKVRLIISAYPFEISEEDTVEFKLSCAGKSLGGAEFKAPEQTGGVNRAEIIFYKNGVTAGKYYIDIYSPFGEFLEG